jgi:diguanylate cyclase (GGDEF)-like protein
LEIFARRVFELNTRGHPTEALQAADAFECVARVAGDDRTVWFLAQARMYAYQALGRYQESVAVGEWLLGVHRATGAAVSEAKTLADLAESLIRLGRLDEGLQHLAHGTAILETAPPTDVRYVSALSSVGEAARAAELYELADAAAQRAETTVSSPVYREPIELHRAELQLEWGLRLEHLGRIEEATVRYRQGEAIVSRWIDAGSPWAKALLALALGKLGRPEEAMALAAEVVLPARQQDQYQEARLAHLALGVALRARGDVRGARREFVAAQELSERAGEVTQRLIFQYELAVLVALEFPGEVTRDLMAALRAQAHLLWRLRTERMSMLRQARHRIELEAARARADEAAAQDPLTGLGNRRGFDRQMAALGPGPLVLMLVDVDRFKRINDVYSHAVGDSVLREVADVLRTHCRPGDVPVRFGGDEFALFLRTDLAGAALVADRIRCALATVLWGEIAPGLRVTVSIGAADLGEGMTARSLFDAADRHLYSAKHRGRDQWAA